MPSVHLSDRGVVELRGAESGSFLQRLVTSDVERLAVGQARFAALLTPQGKILVDFFIVHSDESKFLLDVPRALVSDLLKRLVLYRLRAKIEIEDRSTELAVAAFWNETAPSDLKLSFLDPRLSGLGQRAIGERVPIESIGTSALDAYHLHRITLGVPQGGRDFIYGNAFPHEANMDQLGGVDFEKGCYIGQEVVSRMEHRGIARTRTVKVAFVDGFVPPEGIDVLGGDKAIGKLGSAASGRGIALVRLDRLADALGSGQPITAGGLAAIVERPSYARFPFPEAGEGARASA